MEPISKDEIIALTNLHPLKIKNIYLFGSRVYGTNRDNSDYDIIMVANNLIEATEIKGSKYNIHIHTPDKFKKDLLSHDIHALECFYAPNDAKILIKEDYPFRLDKQRLKKSFLNSSHNSWVKAKNKINEYSIIPGIKSAFHALRILNFGIQVVHNEKIVNFAAANDYWFEMETSNEFEWRYFKEKYLPVKIRLENELKNC